MTPSGANAQNNTAGGIVQGSVPGKPVVSMPATNLNIGMDLWSASPGGAGAAKVRSNPSGASSALAPPTMIGCEGVMPDQWIQVLAFKHFRFFFFLFLCLFSVPLFLYLKTNHLTMKSLVKFLRLCLIVHHGHACAHVRL